MYFAEPKLIYVVDSGNDRLIRLTKGDSSNPETRGGGSGTGQFQLKKPTSCYIDKNGIYYVADSKNARVLRWDLTASIYTTTAGKLGQFGNASDTFGGGFLGIDMDNVGGLYVSDSSNHRVMYFPPKQTRGIQIAGTGQAGSAANQLNEPMFFYLDSKKTLFIADHKNRRIQKWKQGASEGVTVADASPPLSLKDPRALTMDSNGNMYIVDNELSQVIKWNPSLQKASCIVGCSGISGNQADQLNRPNFIQFDPDGDLLVSDTGNNRVQLFSFYVDQNCREYCFYYTNPYSLFLFTNSSCQ